MSSYASDEHCIGPMEAGSAFQIYIEGERRKDATNTAPAFRNQALPNDNSGGEAFSHIEQGSVIVNFTHWEKMGEDAMLAAEGQKK